MLKFVFNVLHTKFGSFGNLGIGLPASASALASTLPAAWQNDCDCVCITKKKLLGLHHDEEITFKYHGNE